MRANAYMATPYAGAAIAAFTEALRLAPNQPDCLAGRAVAHLARNEPDKAIEDLGTAIGIGPARSDFFATRGDAWVMKGEYHKAIQDINEAIRLDPQDAEYDLDRSEYQLKLAWILATCPEAQFRDGRRAVELARQAVAADSDADLYVLSTLAAAHAEAGDFDEAVDWQTKALDLVDADDKEMRDDLDSRLEMYKARKPYRETHEVTGAQLK